MKRFNILSAALLATAVAIAAHAGDAQPADEAQAAKGPAAKFTGKARDAWIDGRLEATYLFNRGLSAFDIETRVNDGRVLLTGAVKTPAQKQLAEQIAISIKGVASVDNQLTVQNDAVARQSSPFVDQVEDFTLAAALKSRLVLNSEIGGLDIDVDVSDRKATLKGTVDNVTQAELAEYIAKNTDGIRAVDNQLEVAKQS